VPAAQPREIGVGQQPKATAKAGFDNQLLATADSTFRPSLLGYRRLEAHIHFEEAGKGAGSQRKRP
jgi:hypothetical protein